MKSLFIQLCIACLVFTARAQETKNQQLPVRISDPALRQIAVDPVLPVKSGGGNALRQAAAKPDLPIKSGDNAQRPKVQQETTAPLRKTDPAPAGGAAQNQTQAAKSQPAVQLPSSLPVKEAKDTARTKISP